MVVGAVLSACGGAGPAGQVLASPTAEPSEPPSPTATPSPQQSESSSEPSPHATGADPQPTSARAHSTTGAEAFVRLWVAAANMAFRTGELDSWKSLSASSCGTCAARMKDVETAYSAGGHIEGGALTILDLAGTPIRSGDIPLVVADLDASPERRYDKTGVLVEKFSGGKTKLVFFMQWDKDHWLISRIKVGIK